MPARNPSAPKRRARPSPKPRPRARPAAKRGRGPASREPRFRLRYLDRSVDPRQDFYRFAAGGWMRTHPVPADKSRWGGFNELAEQNLLKVRRILEECAARPNAPRGSVPQLVGDLFRSALDVRRRNALGLEPIRDELQRVENIDSPTALIEALAVLHGVGIDGLFATAAYADRKNSSVYALYLWQGGLSLPDREYYLAPSFAPVRAKFLAHLAKMFRRLGRAPVAARADAAAVLDLETAIATASRSQTELRDAPKNYQRATPAELESGYPATGWGTYLKHRGVPSLEYAVVGQPEFLKAIDGLIATRPIADLRTYLAWQVLHAAAPRLDEATESEDFRFFHGTLLGQKEPEPRWRRAAREIDGALGEALGRLYVERYFPPEARRRMGELVDDLRAVFRSRLASLAWMTPETRARALEKFDRFTAKIGHPEKFRDYSSVGIRPDDYVGNLRHAAAFEDQRQIRRVGQPVDRSEWHMTPPTVNAYFDATQNEIVFPAGILQPHFFDLAADDAVNYGAIGAVIGHEITHGYDDQGRQFDADGNLKDWWTPADATEFTARAKRIIDQYGAFEPLKGFRVNGELTQGENIADFGGVSIAFEALERRLAADPSRRRVVDGFTPEQRFFLAYAQVWRENAREPELKRRLTVDPHSPGRYRAIGPLSNFPPFYEAFGVGPGDPMWRDPAVRAEIW